MKVTSRGARWRVARRWLPWRRRIHVDDLGASGTAPTLGDDYTGLLIGVAVLIGALPFVLLAVLVAVELLLLALVLPIAVLARVVLGRTWRVEVRFEQTLVWEGEAGTWAQSRELIRRIAADIRRGETSDFPWLKGYGIVVTPEPRQR